MCRVCTKNTVGKDRDRLSTSTWKCFNPSSNEYSEVYAVIDALDECVDKSQKTIWNALIANLKKRVANLRLLYTSRHIDHIERTVPGSVCIENTSYQR